MATNTLAERAAELPPGIDPLLTTKQLMAHYGVSNWTVNEWVKDGCPVEPVKVQGRRFDLAKVKKWMTAQEAPTAA